MNRVKIASGETKRFSLTLQSERDYEIISSLAKALQITKFLNSEKGKNYDVIDGKLCLKDVL